MNVLVTGASGMVGAALIQSLEERGHRAIKLTRAGNRDEASKATWNPTTGQIDLSRVGALDAVVHLAGEPIAKRWTPEVKRRIRESRVNGTRLVCEALAGLPLRPKVLVCASATGFYGDRGDEWLDESSVVGKGFLADVCREIEWVKGQLA